MIIHTHLTDGYLPWAELLLGSLKAKHGDKDIQVFVTTRGLSKPQIQQIKSWYSNISVHNKELDFNKLKKLSGGVSVPELLKAKKVIEGKTGNVTNRARRVWKQFASVEDRYRTAIPFIVNKAIQEGKHKHMLHLDVDMYINNSLDPLFELMRNNDISLKLRSSRVYTNTRIIVGYAIGFALNDKVVSFLRTWGNIIDQIPLKDKPKGYGQNSMYEAYVLHKDSISWGYMPSHFTAHYYNMNILKKMGDPLLLSGNKGKGDISLKSYIADFRSKHPSTYTAKKG